MRFWMPLEVNLAWTWFRARFSPLRRPGWRETKGQAVFEYFLLFLFLGMIAAVIYRFAAPLIEGLIVNTANQFIARNVAGEN